MTRGAKRRDIPLPEWFDLKKYAGASKLSIEEWRVQLLARALIGAVQPGDSAGVDAIRDRVRANGILKASDIPKGYFDGPAPSAVDVLSFEEMRERSQNKIFETEQSAVGDAYLKINLRMPWQVLHKQIKEAVAALQRPYIADLKKQITPGEWAKMKVLPYIDLRQWAREAGKRLSHAAVARVLFPYKSDREGGENEDAVRTLEKLIPKILDSRFLLSMRVILPGEK